MVTRDSVVATAFAVAAVVVSILLPLIIAALLGRYL